MGEQTSAIVLPEDIPFDDEGTPRPIGRPIFDEGTPRPTGQPSLDSRYYAYLSDVGIPQDLGTTMWLEGCVAARFQGGVTFNDGLRDRCEYQPPPGWVILEKNVEIVRNRKNRGGVSSGIIAEGGSFEQRVEEIGSKFQIAIDKAIKAEDFELKRKLELEYQAYKLRFYSVGATKNTAYLQVTANGGLFARSEIEAKLMVRIMKM